MAKRMDEERAESIRAAYQGGTTLKLCAEIYGGSISSIHKMLKRRGWLEGRDRGILNQEMEKNLFQVYVREVRISLQVGTQMEEFVRKFVVGGANTPTTIISIRENFLLENRQLE